MVVDLGHNNFTVGICFGGFLGGHDLNYQGVNFGLEFFHLS